MSLFDQQFPETHLSDFTPTGPSDYLRQLRPESARPEQSAQTKPSQQLGGSQSLIRRKH